MFGYGQKETAPAPNFSAGNEQEKINQAVGLLAMASCERQVMALQNCADQNRIDPTDENRLQTVCGSSVESLGRCMQSVNEEEVFGQLLSISGEACPRQMQSLQSCVERNGERNLEACEREFLSTVACGADSLLSAVQRAQGSPY